MEREAVKHGYVFMSHQKCSQLPVYRFYVSIHDVERGM